MVGGTILDAVNLLTPSRLVGPYLFLSILKVLLYDVECTGFHGFWFSIGHRGRWASTTLTCFIRRPAHVIPCVVLPMVLMQHG